MSDFDSLPADASDYNRGVLHAMIVFIPVIAFLVWWLMRAVKQQQAPTDSAQELSALGESKYLRELFLMEMVFVSAQELTNVCNHLHDLKKGEGDTRAKLVKRRDQVRSMNWPRDQLMFLPFTGAALGRKQAQCAIQPSIAHRRPARCMSEGTGGRGYRQEIRISACSNASPECSSTSKARYFSKCSEVPTNHTTCTKTKLCSVTRYSVQHRLAGVLNVVQQRIQLDRIICSVSRKSWRQHQLA
jgi:hypothetical protein